LNNSEKQILTNLLRDDAGLANSEPASSARLSWRQVRYVFIDWRIYLYVIIAIGDLAVFKCLTMYLPELVQDMGHSKEEEHLMTIPFYFVACISCLLAGYSSSRRNQHAFHIAFCLSIALLGFILMITLFNKGNIVIYISTSIAFSGTISTFPLLLAWLTNNVGGHTKRAMAIGFLIGIGQIGGVLAPQVRLLFMKS
jgi:cyanate permease